MIQINGTIKLGRTIDAATRKAIVEMVRASHLSPRLHSQCEKR